MKTFIILFLIFCACFAQGEIADTNTVSDSVNVVDTNTLSDTTQDLYANKKVSWYFMLSPRVGSDKIQKEYADFLKQRSDSILVLIKDEYGSDYRQNWFQPSSASGISFNLETGLSVKTNKNSALNIGAGYAFNQSRAVYNIEYTPDSTEVLRMRSRLINNTLSFSLNYKAGFDSSFFHIKGIDAAGFYAGGAFLLSRYFERDTIISSFDKFDENRRENYDGFGGSGRIGLFAQKKIGRHSLFEYSIGYLFSATTGYENFWSREFEWEFNRKKRDAGKILSIANSFELSFSLIF